MKYFELDVMALTCKGNSILEFCNTPLMIEEIKISTYEKYKLKKIVSKVEKVTRKL